MRTFEKDYEYLLLNLIPQHRLAVTRRRLIDQAIRSGSHQAMRRAAFTALEDLCEAGYFRRTESEVIDDHVLTTYVRNRGRYQIRVKVPASEWRTIDQPPKKPPAPDDRVAPVDTTFAILPDIIRSLYIDNRPESTFERLSTVVASLPEWLGAVRGHLLLSEERLGSQSEAAGRVTTLPERAILSRGVYERCRRSGDAQIFGLDAAQALGIGVPDGVSGNGAETRVAIAPIFSGSSFWGILELWFDSGSGESNLRTRVDVATGMIEQIIENTVRLENLTSVDKLTGVYNRNYYEGQVQIEIERATRSKSMLSMLVMDLDDFKKINDTHGHRTGDEALALVAELVRKNLRKIDLPFRYGGEEFVVLLPGTSEVEAVYTAERLRSVIAQTDVLTDSNGDPIAVRVSIGGAVFPEHASSEEELFARADSALYRAKRMGKNRVEFYRES